VRTGKYPNKIKIVGKGGCVQHHFSKKKRVRCPIVCISLLNSALHFLQYRMYVNIKKTNKKKKKKRNRLQ